MPLPECNQSGQESEEQSESCRHRCEPCKVETCASDVEGIDAPEHRHRVQHGHIADGHVQYDVDVHAAHGEGGKVHRPLTKRTKAQAFKYRRRQEEEQWDCPFSDCGSVAKHMGKARRAPVLVVRVLEEEPLEGRPLCCEDRWLGPLSHKDADEPRPHLPKAAADVEQDQHALEGSHLPEVSADRRKAEYHGHWPIPAAQGSDVGREVRDEHHEETAGPGAQQPTWLGRYHE
mmetsp:Transcript_79239/g.232694  ORF Transcript_79239/g.232694 Transcript_79239/m.232694 type:complete len:232 (+) Transcript_79239:1273-1968(+)